jgi:hypothetical protein
MSNTSLRAPRSPAEVGNDIYLSLTRRYGTAEMPRYVQEAVKCLDPMKDMTNWDARHFGRSAIDLADDVLEHLKKWQGQDSRTLKAELKRVIEWDTMRKTPKG